MEYSLPASITALGGRFSVEALRDFKGWVEGMPRPLLSGAASLKSFDGPGIEWIISKPKEIRERFVAIHGGQLATDTLVDQFVVRAMTGVDDVDNGFEDSRNDFSKRWKQWAGKSIPVAITVSGASFRVKSTAEVTVPTLIGGKRLDTNAIQNVYRRILSPTTNLEVTILQGLSQLSGIPFDEKMTEKKRNAFVVESLQSVGTRSTDFTKAVTMAMPLLPRVTGMTIPVIAEQPSIPDLRSFLDAAKVFFDVHLPEVLQSYGVATTVVQAAKTRFPIQQLDTELGKFAKGKATQEETIALQSTKNAVDAYYDALGQNCICRYGFELERENFQPIRMVHPKTGEQFGVIYALKEKVNGKPSLVLAGVEPRKRFAYTVNTTQFMRGLLDNLAKVAQANGLTGGVYTNVGKGGVDDGRIAQYDIIRNALQREQKEYVELSRGERIQFPKGFNEPIKYLWKLR